HHLAQDVFLAAVHPAQKAAADGCGNAPLLDEVHGMAGVEEDVPVSGPGDIAITGEDLIGQAVSVHVANADDLVAVPRPTENGDPRETGRKVAANGVEPGSRVEPDR